MILAHQVTQKMQNETGCWPTNNCFTVAVFCPDAKPVKKVPMAKTFLKSPNLYAEIYCIKHGASASDLETSYDNVLYCMVVMRGGDDGLNCGHGEFVCSTLHKREGLSLWGSCYVASTFNWGNANARLKMPSHLGLTRQVRLVRHNNMPLCLLWFGQNRKEDLMRCF